MFKNFLLLVFITGSMGFGKVACMMSVSTDAVKPERSELRRKTDELNVYGKKFRVLADIRNRGVQIGIAQWRFEKANEYLEGATNSYNQWVTPSFASLCGEMTEKNVQVVQQNLCAGSYHLDTAWKQFDQAEGARGLVGVGQEKVIPLGRMAAFCAKASSLDLKYKAGAQSVALIAQGIRERRTT